MPEPLRGSTFSEEVIRHSSSHPSTPTLGSETENVHICRRSQNKCAVITMIGGRSQKALWDSDAGRCIISYDCYNSLYPKIQNRTVPKQCKIRAVNGMFISNRGDVMSPSKSTRRDSHSLSFVQTTVAVNDTWP